MGFFWKPTEMERVYFFVVKLVDNRNTVDTNILSNVVPILCNNWYIDKVYPK